MGEQWKTGQDVIKHPTGSSIAGFNRRIFGDAYNDAFQYPHERTDGALHGGWDLACRLIEEGKIFRVHNFHRSHGGCPDGYAFQYGGTWVCNTCNRDHLDAEWWKIKTYKDGTAWCCIGIGFEDLQESDNYAFGDTLEEAINGYADTIISQMENNDGA